MADITKFGRKFLTADPTNTDAVFWSARYVTYNWTDKPAWNAALNIMSGRTQVSLHTANEENDENFLRFREKLNVLEKHIKSFVENTRDKKAGEGYKPGHTERYWLNPDDSVHEHYFTGHVIISYTADNQARISIGDCHRTIVQSVNLAEWASDFGKKANDRTWESLESILREIDAMRVAMDEVVAAVKVMPPEPKKKSRKKKEFTQWLS